jgi:hypothetical protein
MGGRGEEEGRRDGRAGGGPERLPSSSSLSSAAPPISFDLLMRATTMLTIITNK